MLICFKIYQFFILVFYSETYILVLRTYKIPIFVYKSQHFLYNEFSQINNNHLKHLVFNEFTQSATRTITRRFDARR